jgi:hypothetical protein
LRAKYYPDGDILHARLKKGASFTWQSIHAGIQTFKKGCVWRVGNGANINIWSDPWIPSSTDRKVISSRGEAVYTRVEDLINPVTEQWDEELLRSILNPVDVNRILEIPLNVGAFDDFLHIT